MSNSYRIRTKVGVDESINILIDQEFEYLEILSLKLLQSQIYTRQCSDYGVIVGRVSVNNGFGIPNAKVSVFIPLDSTDEVDPVISELYPYKTLTDLNDDGYRYNLLPYKASHSGHVPTGTFFERTDVLIDPTLIEVYDKYYKYTTITNSSGDYMIFGVPVGSQTIVMDVDLSDIGEFSLSPQDLIRMGVATSNQVAGTKFKSSTNLRELPQLITLNKTIDVSPLWGEPGLCNLGITRTDFDLANESNINIRPTAIFMGSIFSTNKSDFLKSNCKPKGGLGDLCSLVAGPGEILAIRQTIQQDIYGRPILESVELDEGGQVIDENGTWLLDVPMNMDYVITNEFGEQVISDDPEKGLPTKGKYRFKIKWNQSPSLSETIRRGYFLVPNIREHGWNTPNTDPLSIIDVTSDYTDYQLAIKSYSFSLDWSDYGYTGVTSSSQANNGKQMIQDAIDCKDTFYELKYNKVYTVSQMIDQYRNGFMNNRFIGVKNILNDTCDSDNNKFPTNDTFYRFDIIYILFTLMMFIVVPILFTLIIVVHVLYAAVYAIGGALTAIGTFYGVMAVIAGVKAVVALAQWTPNFGLAAQFGVEAAKSAAIAIVVGGAGLLILEWVKKLPLVKFPLLTYPDCETCECDTNGTPNSGKFDSENASNGVNTAPPPSQIGSGVIAKLYSGQKRLDPKTINPIQIPINQIFLGEQIDPDYPSPGSPTPIITRNIDSAGFDDNYFFTSSLTLPERINLFNTKAKYFDNINNPGGGVNRVKVSFNPVNNPGKFHYDNVIVIICSPESATGMTSGSLYTFQNPTDSLDINTTLLQNKNIYGNNAITGSSLNNTTISVSYSKFDGSGNEAPVSYTIPLPNSADTNYHKFPIDLEYFQVITGMTYSTFKSLNGGTLPNSLKSRYLDNNMTIYQINNSPVNCLVYVPTSLNTKPIECLNNYENLSVIIMNRGVDPYSSKMNVEYDLSRIFGYNTYGNVKVSGDYKLNIPINGGFKNVKHNLSTNTTLDLNGNQLYFNSFNYKPSSQFSGFSSNMVSYYSMLDSDNLTFTPSCSNTLNLGTYSNSSPNGLKVKNYNDFTKEGIVKPYYVYPNNPPYPPNCYWLGLTGNTGSTQNRGYFENEIIEGGSLMGLTSSLSYPGNTPPSVNTLYFSPKYPSTLSPTYNVGSSLHQIVMRSDRLPTSTTLTENCGNSFLLQGNESFSLFAIPSGGTIGQSFGSGQTGGGSLSAGKDMQDENNNFTNKLIDSSTCAGSVNLECYSYDSVTKSLVVNSGDCQRNYLGERIFENGCYITVTVPIFSLIGDLLLLKEWSSRLNIAFGACRNVWSHIFTNNWINGSLFAFAFKNSVSYSTQNKPINGFCSDTIVFHRNTNNFYYRSSPYNDFNKQFTGKHMDSIDNNYNLLYPTTIMDLGPRNTYMEEIVMSDDFDGYVMNKLDSTTYGDVSEILNLFILSRLANQSFLKQLLAGTNILEYFSRTKLTFKGITIKGDGDYSQMISINSELGVAPFESMNYPDPTPGNQSPIYINPANIGPAFGIFFSSETSIRDFITPKRTIIKPTLQIGETCAFSNINVYSQNVPFYQWKILTNDSIFGSEMNEWDSTPVTTGFFNRNYQDMDRLLSSSKYFRTNQTLSTQYYKGYIYSVNPTGGLNSDYSSWSPNSPVANDITVGAPFHFYFGLKRGKSAYDRFLTKWVDTTNIID